MGLFLQVPLIFLLYSSSCPQATAWCYFGMIGNSCGLCTPPAYPDCSVLCALVDKIGDGSCDLWQVNTEECGWDGEDCINPNYPECKGADIDLLANGVCDNASPLNTAACNFDGDDCTVFNFIWEGGFLMPQNISRFWKIKVARIEVNLRSQSFSKLR